MMMFTHSKIKLATLSVVFCGVTLMLQGCQSTIDDIATQTHGSQAGDGYTYGTGPNKTRPYPQTSPVNINNVGGATPKYEALSRGGNTDYTVLGQNYMVWLDCTSYQEVGTASWYGPGFHGNNTSNGEYYDQKGYTAAHKNLPLPSYLKVTNLENGRTVIVRVNDRGPFHGSRIIDLSEGAAKAIDMTGKGTAKVKLELINVRGDSNVTTEGGSGSILTGTKGAIAGAVIGAVINKSGASETLQNIKEIHEFVQNVDNGNRPSIQEVRSAAGAMSEMAQDLERAADAQTLANANAAKSQTVATTSAATKATNATITTTMTTNTTYATPTGKTVNEVITTTTAQAPSNVQSPSNATTNYQVDYVSPAAQAMSALVSGQPYVQFFTSSSQWRAAQIQAKVQKQTPYPVIVAAEDNLYRVMVGPIKPDDLLTMVEYFKQLGYADAFIKHIK